MCAHACAGAYEHVLTCTLVRECVCAHVSSHMHMWKTEENHGCHSTLGLKCVPLVLTYVGSRHQLCPHSCSQALYQLSFICSPS